MQTREVPQRRPEWLQKARNLTTHTHGVSSIIRRHRLHSVCHEARCPNLGECYSRGTATFLLMGNICTRSCKFCQIGTLRHPGPLDPNEPVRIAQASKEMGLRHIVLTSVTRDDIPDEGISHFLQTIKACRELMPNTRIEVLTPDFHAREDLISQFSDMPPDIFNHNIETVKRLQKIIRPLSGYDRSFKALDLAKKHMPSSCLTKTGLMVGLGETDKEVIDTLKDLADHGMDIVNIGQYLRPSHRHMPPKRYVHPDLFQWYKKEGLKLGFKYIFSGPYVRSSYMADLQGTHDYNSVR